MERSNRGVKLTESGRTLLCYTEQLLQMNNAAYSALKERQITGKISFGVPTDYVQNFLTQFLPTLMRSFPTLEPRIVCDRSRTLRSMVQRGELDIAVVAAEEESSDEVLLWSEKLSWVGPTNIDLSQYDSLPIAVFTGDCIIRDELLKDLEHLERETVIVVESPVMENLAEAVNSGMAISLLPESLIEKIHCSPLSVGDSIPERHLKINVIYTKSFEESILNQLIKAMKESASYI